MASSPRTKSDESPFRSSPARGFCSSTSSFASSSSTFSGRSSSVFTRSSSLTRVRMYGFSSLSSSVRFQIDHPAKSSGRSISVQKKTCTCSPTAHPGSFRCSLHRSSRYSDGANGRHCRSDVSGWYRSNSGLNFRRSAMANSLVRIGVVEGGDSVKRALSALIRPSSHQRRRREGFQPRPSRLSLMSIAEDHRTVSDSNHS